MKSSIIAVAVFLPAMCSLQARDMTFGGQLTFLKPSGDLGNTANLNGKPGYGIGVHLLIDMQNGHALVPRLDFASYKRKQELTVTDGKTPLTGTSCRANTSANLGVDYHFFPGGKINKGFFLLGGLGYSFAKFTEGLDFENPPNPSPDLNASQSKGAFYCQVGGGYCFTPQWGVELRYSRATYKDVDLSCTWNGYRMDNRLGDVSAPVLHASCVVRFPASAPAAAGTSARSHHFGGQLGFGRYVGEWGRKDHCGGNYSLSFGLHDLITLQKEGKALMLRLDVDPSHKMEKETDPQSCEIDGKTRSVTFNKYSTLALGADYHHFLGGKANQGWYVGLGAGLSVLLCPVMDAETHEALGTEGGVAPYLAGSVGSMFRPDTGFELRFTCTRYSLVTAPALNVSVFYRM